MHTQASLVKQLDQMGIDGRGTILVHSSMKRIGEVEGGADTVLDALSAYMEDGLLVLPTHTWNTINADNPRFHVMNTPVCVGILPELFRNRPSVVRSLHPTHSVAALGRDAVSFTAGDERCDTPCARHSAWGRLLDQRAKILLVGVDLRRNTYIHGIEEWLDIPGRLTEHHEQLYTVLGDGTEILVPSRRHCGLSWSEHFWKVEGILEAEGALSRGKLGEAEVLICDAVGLNDILTTMLTINPNLFSDNEPI